MLRALKSAHELISFTSLATKLWEVGLSLAACQRRSQKFSTGGASICSIPFCPFPFSCPDKNPLGLTRRPTALRNHIPMKNYVFS